MYYSTTIQHFTSTKTKLWLPLFTLLFLGLLAGCQKDPEENPQKKQSIVILFENDVHCAIDGYPKISGLRDAIADTAWAALVSSGDFLQGSTAGSILHGQYIVDIMRSMHYDAVGLGNHEFDYLVPRLMELLANFNAPILCCNLFDMQDHRLFASHTVRTYGNRRVAFVGVLSPDTELKDEVYAFRDTDGQPIYTLRQYEYIQLVQQAVDASRAEGADYVVLLAHLGEQNGGDRFTSNELIAATHGIDAVLDAHSHHVVDTVLTNSQGQSVLLANTGTKFAHVGKLYIGPDGRMDITLIPTEQISQTSPAVSAAVQQVTTQIENQTGQVVANSEVPLLITDGNGNRMVRNAETNAGDLVTDALRWFIDAQIGLCNGGAIRVDLPAGDLTYGNIFDLVPFDNPIVKLQVTGTQLLDVLQNGTNNLPDEDGNFPQISGLRFTVTVSDLSISNVEVLQPDGNYAPLNPNATYTVAVTDFALVGGFSDLLRNCPVLQYTVDPCRDALVQYISQSLGGIIGQQYASPQERITINN